MMVIRQRIEHTKRDIHTYGQLTFNQGSGSTHLGKERLNRWHWTAGYLQRKRRT